MGLSTELSTETVHKFLYQHEIVWLGFLMKITKVQ